MGLIVFLHLNYMGVVGKAPATEDPILRQLAVHLAERGGLCTAGFVRNGRYVLYSAPERVGV